MEKKLSEDFDNFINKISLNQVLKDDIINKHTSLTSMIKEDPPEGYDIIKTRISGSYGKKIEINEYDPNKNPDVDIVLIINSNKDDPITIINDFYNYLKDKKANVVKEVRIQSNSIGLKYKNIDVDIVLAKENSDGSLRIASNKHNRWVDSNCLKQIDYMNLQSNKYTTFKYRDMMKLFKYLNKEILNTKIKSFTLEMLIHLCIPTPSVDLTLRKAFSDTLGKMAVLKQIDDIKDCCDYNKNGYDEKDRISFANFQAEIKILYDKSILALNGNRKKWEEIFGDRFPEQPNIVVKNNNKTNTSQTPWCYE